jgi:hypothetical protein
LADAPGTQPYEVLEALKHDVAAGPSTLVGRGLENCVERIGEAVFVGQG